jgi:glycosyltransferase involved in cell wall biosynthesis
MQNSPLVSILTVTYKHENYIAQCIESILSSTYTNFELIVVDDVSPDNTFEIAKKYELKDNRVKVYRNEINHGDYPNRNIAASYANGKYIKYVDGDDLIYPYGLEQLVFYMEQFPDAGYGLCSLSQDIGQIYPIMLSPTEAYTRHYIQHISLFHKANLSSIINKEIFDKVGGYTGKELLGDYEMWNILSKKSNVVLMPEGIVWHRTHAEQLSNQMIKPEKQIKYIILEKELLSATDCPLSDINKQILISKSVKKQARFILKQTKSYGLKIGNQLRKQTMMSWIEVLKKAFS